MPLTPGARAAGLEDSEEIAVWVRLEKLEAAHRDAREYMAP